MITKISTADMSRDEWVLSRKSTIGGSDAATIVGLNPHSSLYALWAEKTGRLPEKDDSESMRLGRDLEEYVARRFTELTGKRVRRDNHTYYNSKYPWAHANIDRAIVGEDAGLECKTTIAHNAHKFTDEEFPANYYVQAVHYMAVTGKSRWYIAVLILGVGFRWYCIERNEEEIHALMIEEQKFYRHIETDEAPPIDGSEATTKAISSIYNAEEYAEESVVPLDLHEDTLEQIKRVQIEITRLTELKTELENGIKAELKNDALGESEKYKVTWRRQSRKSFNAKKFAKEHPELNLDSYYTESNYRVFNLTEKEI